MFGMVFFGVSGVSAQTCDEIGGACRNGGTFGCVFPELYISGPPSVSCLPFGPQYECCKPSFNVTECSTHYGECRGTFYGSCPTGENLEPYDCAGPGLMCCVAPPNPGAACTGPAPGNYPGTCQQASDCAGNISVASVCKGGIKCCVPKIGEACISQDTGKIGVCQLSSNCVAPGRKETPDASCLGATCCVDYPPPTLNSASAPNCTIPKGSSGCDVIVSWQIGNAFAPDILQDGVSFSNSASESGVTRSLSQGPHTFTFQDNGVILGTRVATASCAPNSSWDGLICAPTGPTCDSLGGYCDLIGSCPGGTSPNDTTSTCSSLQTCCVPTSPPPATPCTGEWTLRAGTCKLQGTCPTTEDTSLSCASGEKCCVPNGVDGNNCNGTATGLPGFCHLSCDPTTQQNDTDGVNCGALTCCVPKSTVCVGNITYKVGSCLKAVDSSLCTGSIEFDVTPICAADEICCIDSPPPPPPSNLCTNYAGACKASCDATEDNKGVTSDCAPAVCCTPKSGVLCAFYAGTCKASCDSATEDFHAGALDCAGSTPACCSSKPDVGKPPIPVLGVWDNPLKWNTINDATTGVLIQLQKLVVILALIFIIIGALLYITSAGDTGRIDVAKKCILGALIGLALGIAAPVFLREVGSILGWTGTVGPDFGTTRTLTELITSVINFILAIVGIIALIMLLIGSFMYLTAAGDEGRIDTGKTIVKYAIIGITVAVAALVIVRQVANFFT